MSKGKPQLEVRLEPYDLNAEVVFPVATAVLELLNEKVKAGGKKEDLLLAVLVAYFILSHPGRELTYETPEEFAEVVKEFCMSASTMCAQQMYLRYHSITGEVQ